MKPELKNPESKHMTDDEFFSFCAQNKELQIERDADYRIIVMEPAGVYGASYETKLLTQVSKWHESLNKGLVVSPSGGYYLSNGAMRAADASWISDERIKNFSKAERNKFIHACPEFVIELMSPSDRLINAKKKMEEWISNGCLLGFLIYRDEQKVFIYKPNREVIEKPFTEKISGEDVLPGFELDLSFMIE